MTVATPLDHEERVWRLDLGSVNAYLVDDGEVTLVDAGTPRSVGELRQGLATAGYDVEGLDRLLVTHYDLDHVGGIAGLDPDCPVYAMEPDASFTAGRRTPPFGNRKGLFQRVAGLLLGLPDQPVERLTDEERIGGFTAYHTPGHTPGHTTFHHAELGVAILGDLVRENDGSLGTLPWPLAYDAGQNRESIRALSARDLDFGFACMGHGEPLVSGGDTVLSRLASVA
ncbi:MBL fold metallo-hydrolase [Haloarchaeobius iranensis]|uniref:Glyoxylase, beta-lactamase superfamily II n=1 Tax=Haloarchaeobius iranensis TaxID=996166 RepID=A0A1G9YMZ0_9EURY|nr:MBL fold metallo-hydrolase [Haloarchaeobius iranensis]SDN10559.1 Glyoxylase, beta-lactamase superfamily II [Haloarchaeobius iranensis]